MNDSMHSTIGSQRTAGMPQRQQGVALLISLMLLLIMTILGITSIQDTVLEERMSSNMRQKQIAFERAELALRVGEQTIRDQNSRPRARKKSDCSPCDFYARGELPTLRESDIWDASSSYTHSEPLSGVATAPQYVVEQRRTIRDSLNTGQQGDQSARFVYRVGGQAVADESGVESILQSTFVTRFQ